MELDPERAPGVYGDGERTQTEIIAEPEGFLTALDAYKARLESPQRAAPPLSSTCMYLN